MLRDNRKGSKEMDENTLLLKEILKQLYILNQKIEALNRYVQKIRPNWQCNIEY